MWSRNRKWLLIFLVAGSLGILGFGINYLIDTSYKGDDSIHFIDTPYERLEALLQAEPFRDKVLYVDFWFSTCGPCIKEFKALPLVKDYFRDRKEIEYLYISHRTRLPNADQLWKNAIREFNLTGWHFMMDRNTENNFWEEMHARDSTVRKGYPRYLIIDNSSGYQNYSAPKPTDIESLKSVLTPLLRP